jgi:uncharacterized glyoxalase superfamily protein PhnB
MAPAASPIPKGFHSLTPSLVVSNAKEALAYYEKAFDAKVLSCKLGPDGQRVIHSEVQVGNSRFMVCDEFPEMGAFGPRDGRTPVALFLYVEDGDRVFNQAVAAGARALMPMMDAFWGDRYGQLKDPYGHDWSVATRKEDLTDEEIQRRADAFFAQMGG